MKQILIALDQLLNTLLFWLLPGKAWADETISARCWRMRHKQPFKTMRAIIDGLFFWEVDHCKSCADAEIKRAHSPKEWRQ